MEAVEPEGRSAYPKSIIKNALAPVDHNKDGDLRCIPTAPKKVKSLMKTSRRNKLFGSLYKKKKNPKAEQNISLSDDRGEVAGFVTLEDQQGSEKKRTLSRLRRRQRNQTPTPKRQRITGTNKRLPVPDKNLPDKNLVDEISKEHEYSSFTQMPSSKVEMPERNLPGPPQDAVTEISALTMTSPQTRAMRMKARRRMNTNEMPPPPTYMPDIKSRQQPPARAKKFVRSQSDVYARPKEVVCPKSTSNDYAMAYQYSSSSCSSSSSDDSDYFEQFSLDCKEVVQVQSSLSSQSSDCTSSDSSGNSCTSSTLPPPIYEDHQQNPSFQSTASNVAKTTRGLAHQVVSGIQGVVSMCFLPEHSSPPKVCGVTGNYLCHQEMGNSDRKEI